VNETHNKHSHFVGYLYMMYLNNARKIEHIQSDIIIIVDCCCYYRNENYFTAKLEIVSGLV
jgi:hypothetical protein